MSGGVIGESPRQVALGVHSELVRPAGTRRVHPVAAERFTEFGGKSLEGQDLRAIR